MQMRKAASVLPEPVGAEMSVGGRARMAGQPSICGSVAEPKRERNHSWTMGWAHVRASAELLDCMRDIVAPEFRVLFAKPDSVRRNSIQYYSNGTRYL